MLSKLKNAPSESVFIAPSLFRRVSLTLLSPRSDKTCPCRRSTRHGSVFTERMLRVANRGRMHRTLQCLHHIYCGL